MKTSMLGETGRRALVRAWPELLGGGVTGADGTPVVPGDLVLVPATLRRGDGDGRRVPGTVTGYAIDKLGRPSAVVHAPAWAGSHWDSWATWIVAGDACSPTDEAGAGAALDEASRRAGSAPKVAPILPEGLREAMAGGWLRLVVEGARTRGGVAVRPGDLVRLPRNVARSRGSQLRAAGTTLGYALGLDGSPCVVVDAVGEDVPDLVRWRTWAVRGSEVIVIDTREAWRLEGKAASGPGRRGPEAPRRGNRS